jgi:hypothetical protein
MGKVWLLWHVREFEDGHDDIKLIGVYSTRAKARAAKLLVCDQPGFRQLPKGFVISDHDVDPERVGWPEGYVTVQPGEDF